MAISINLTGGDLLSLKATGVNEADATELKEGLDSLLGIAKFSIKGMLPTIRAQDPDGGSCSGGNLPVSLNAKSEGNNCPQSTFPTPEGFDSWVVKQGWGDAANDGWGEWLPADNILLQLDQLNRSMERGSIDNAALFFFGRLAK